MPDVNSEGFAAMALALHAERTVDATASRVVDYALRAVDASYGGIVLVERRGHTRVVASSDPVAAQLEQVGARGADAPEQEVAAAAATDGGSLLVVEDVRAEQRWPAWTQAAAAAGVGSLLAVRVATTATTLGSLNLYAAEPGHFTGTDRETVSVLARHAAVALDAVREHENLWRAIDARWLIGQAQGILMERFAMTSDQAFSVLRRYSQDNNVKLRDVAEKLVTTRRLPDGEGPGTPSG